MPDDLLQCSSSSGAGLTSTCVIQRCKLLCLASCPFLLISAVALCVLQVCYTHCSSVFGLRHACFRYCLVDSPAVAAAAACAWQRHASPRLQTTNKAWRVDALHALHHTSTMQKEEDWLAGRVGRYLLHSRSACGGIGVDEPHACSIILLLKEPLPPLWSHHSAATAPGLEELDHCWEECKMLADWTGKVALPSVFLLGRRTCMALPAGLPL